MKNSFLIGILSVVLSLLVIPAQAETTQVCVDIKDKNGQTVKDKTGKVKQNCRSMKKHQKLEGTRVPEKK